MTGPSHGHQRRKMLAHTEAGTKIMLLAAVPGMLADSVICTRKKSLEKLWVAQERLIFGISLLSYLKSVHDQSSKNEFQALYLIKVVQKNRVATHPTDHIPLKWFASPGTNVPFFVTGSNPKNRLAILLPAPPVQPPLWRVESDTRMYSKESWASSHHSHQKVTTVALLLEIVLSGFTKSFPKKNASANVKNTETLVLKPRSGYGEHLEEPPANLEVTTKVSTENGPLKPINPILWMVSFFSFQPSLESWVLNSHESTTGLNEEASPKPGP